MPKNGDRLTHRELQLGDTISLEFSNVGWDRAKIVGQTDSQWQVFRPHMGAGDGGYPSVRVELFSIWKDSDKTVVLIDREL